MITDVRRTNGDKAKAARLLDIGRKTLTVNSSSTRSNEGVEGLRSMPFSRKMRWRRILDR